MPRLTLGLASLLIATTSAHGALTPGALAEQCESSDAAEQAFCRGYIQAAVDTSSKGICAPESVKASTTQDLVVAYLKDASEEETAAVVVREQLEEMFPCKGKKSKKSKENGGKGQNWSNKDRIGK